MVVTADRNFAREKPEQRISPDLRDLLFTAARDLEDLTEQLRTEASDSEEARSALRTRWQVMGKLHGLARQLPVAGDTDATTDVLNQLESLAQTAAGWLDGQISEGRDALFDPNQCKAPGFLRQLASGYRGEDAAADSRTSH